ncbi:MAG: alpha/beta fold hydrolase, partial [Planctomycetes bacterium]|nr:alpha/beta fold hydrolase [Planctomycetota bacterium]
MRHRIPVPAAALLALLLAAAAAGAQETPSVVTLKTKDGLSLQADWYRGEEGMPGVVGLHMYPADRSSWRPLALARPKGWHFLALDLRGYGGSARQGEKDLSGRVKDRDPALFGAMWQDALAGVAHLRTEGKCDPGRIGLVGASVGCSIAFDAAVRERVVSAVAALSPGTAYLGIPTPEHLRSWPGIPVLLLAPKEEEGPVLELAEALKRHPWVDRTIVPGGRELHGTNLFGKVEGIESRLAAWLEAALGREILDGEVDPFEAAPPAEGRGGIVERTLNPAGRIHLRADPNCLNVAFAGAAEILPTFSVTVATIPAEADRPPDIQRFRGVASASGEMAGAWLDSWSGTAW